MSSLRLSSRQRGRTGLPRITEIGPFFFSLLRRSRNSLLVLVVIVLLYFTFSRQGQLPTYSPSAYQPSPPDVRNTGFYGQDDGSSHQEELVGKTGLLAPTRLLANASGNIIFERLYLFQGAMYIVTDEPEAFPELKFMASQALDLETNWRDEDNSPTPQDMQIISRQKARQVLPTVPLLLSGTTFLCTDHPQFLNHYYHYAAEVLLSQWRTYITLDPHVTTSGHTILAAPRRIMFRNVTYDALRDKADMNLFVIRAAFGDIQHLFQRDWNELAAHPHLYALDRVVQFDRAAAQKGPSHKAAWKCVAEAFSLPKVDNWWSPLRESVVANAMAAKGVEANPSKKPVVTYISRQLDRLGRRLKDSEHEALVISLKAAERRYGFELQIVQMEEVPKVEQIQLLSRTTILMSVHGNGLSGMLWMPDTVQSTVMEFFVPGGFRRDYEITAKFLGHRYYGFWNDTSFTESDLIDTDPDPGGPNGMNGSNFIIFGPTVVALLAKILSKRR